MANLIELLGGIAQGLQAGKEQKRQSLLDQLRLQHEKLGLDLAKAQIKAAEQEMKFKMIDRQKKEFEGTGEARGNVLGELGFIPEQTKEQLGQVPQETFQDFRRLLQGAQPLKDIGLQETVSAVKQVPAVKKAPKEYKPEPTLKEKVEEKRALTEVEESIKAKYKQPSVAQEKAKPGSTPDEILNARYKWLQDNPQNEVYKFYKKIRLNNPSVVDSLASQDTGVPQSLIPIFIQFKDFKEFRNAAIEKQRKKPKTPADFQELLSQAQVWFGYKPKPFFEFLEKIDRATGLSK